MFRFSYTESVSGAAVVVSREKFHEIIARETVKNTCKKIVDLQQSVAAQGGTADISRLKRTLPAFCWHAWFDGGKRKNDAAHPSGLIMIDVDHVAQPRELFATIAEQARQMGLVAAHVTPSTKGLRLVFPVPNGASTEEAQGYYAHALGLEVDACTKDLARLSFVVPEGYWLYVDEEGLFEGAAASAAEFPAAASPFRDRAKVAFSSGDSRGSSPTEKPTSDQSLNDSAELLNGSAELQNNSADSLNNSNDSQNNSAEKKFSNSLILDKKPLDQKSLERFDKDFEGIPYPVLVASLEEILGGKPAHGSRNNFIFSMAAYLRYVCNDEAGWIASILPTYGEEPGKWRRTIESACQRSQYKVMPNVMKRAIALAKRKVELSTNTQGSDRLPPALPEKLPKLIKHLIKNVPDCCKPSVANGVFPALATHLHGVKFWLIDGTEKEATFMSVNMAPQSSGKSAVNKVVEYILADIVERDEKSRMKLEEWGEKVESLGSNKQKPKRPDDVCMQIMVSDMTNAAFVQRLKDAGDHYLYTNLEELDLLKQLQTNGTKDVGKIICLCFDNGKYGQERVGTKSVTGRVDVRWNWNASSTIQKGINFFRGRLVDGTLSRINFSTIIRDPGKPFKYGRYDEKYAEQLKPYIANLNLATGYIECKQALALAQQLSDKCQEEGALSGDETFQELAYRAVTIAYLKAMVLYIANDQKWNKDIATFTEWSLRYDLWCKMHFFGDQLQEAKEKEKVPQRRGRQNLLSLLPNPFTVQDAIDMRQAQALAEEGTGAMISQWKCRGYIEEAPEVNRYIKTEKYLKRFVKG